MSSKYSGRCCRHDASLAAPAGASSVAGSRRTVEVRLVRRKRHRLHISWQLPGRRTDIRAQVTDWPVAVQVAFGRRRKRLDRAWRLDCGNAEPLVSGPWHLFGLAPLRGTASQQQKDHTAQRKAPAQLAAGRPQLSCPSRCRRVAHGSSSRQIAAEKRLPVHPWREQPYLARSFFRPAAAANSKTVCLDRLIRTTLLSTVFRVIGAHRPPYRSAPFR